MAPDGCTIDAAGGIWFSDALGKQVVRVVEGGEITHRLTTGFDVGSENASFMYLRQPLGNHDFLASNGLGSKNVTRSP